MSGFLGQILGSLAGGATGNEAGQVGAQPGAPQMGALAGVLRQVLVTNGGVAGLVSQFEAAGLGAHVQSWVGDGANQPVTPAQIGQVFSDDQLAQWADQAGTTPDKMRAVLAEALPHAVDHATPEGMVPQSGAVPDLTGLVGRLFAQRPG